MQDLGEEDPRHCHLRQLGHHALAVAHDPGANLDQFFAERRQRPLFDLFRQSQRAQEVRDVLGDRVKLEARLADVYARTLHGAANRAARESGNDPFDPISNVRQTGEGPARLRNLRSFRRELQLVGHPRKIRQRLGLHLAHHLATVDPYGNLADADVAGNLLIHAALHDLTHYLAFARGQRLEALSKRGQRRFFLASGTVTCKTELDRIEQVLIAERLRQKLDRSSLHGLNRHGNVAVPGDEDNRQMNVRGRKLSLEIKPTSPGQSYVEHEAGRSVRAPGLQKFRHRRQRFHLQTDRSQQAAKRLSDRRIVIDDDDGGLCLRHRFRSRHTGPLS
jgi:hypothetical protein